MKRSKLATYILLDRSGSMANRWEEAIGSINSYANGIDTKKVDAKITVSVFDNNGGKLEFDVVRDNKEWKDIKKEEISPRGYTPLYDAMGKIVAMAEKDNEKKSVIVVVTDGAENASKELNKEQAKAAVKRCTDRGWEVLFLGADFDSSQDAQSVGLGLSKVMGMSTGNYVNTMRSMSNATMMYASSASASINFSDDDKAKALGKKSWETK